MNLYLISQGAYDGYDTYDCAVVAAENEEDARNTSPDPSQPIVIDWEDDQRVYGWCQFPEHVAVKLIGTAVDGTERGVVCASFNAG